MEDGTERLGIVQNETPKVMMFYDFDRIAEESLKREFLVYADQWWWESNQMIPINFFIGVPFDKYQHFLAGHPKKSIKEVHGPRLCLADHYIKRIKKRRVEVLSRTVTE